MNPDPGVGEGVTGIVPVVNLGTATKPRLSNRRHRYQVSDRRYLKGVNDDDVGGGRAILRFQPMDKLIIDANYTTQTETSGGSSRYTPAGTTAFNGGVGSITHRCKAAICATPM